MLGTAFRQKSPARVEAAARVEAWTRERFGLAPEDTVSVSQVTCVLPGCPPLETAVAFWTGDGRRHHFKIFKPTVDITAEDLPFSWMREALEVPTDFQCDCC